MSCHGLEGNVKKSYKIKIKTGFNNILSGRTIIFKVQLVNSKLFSSEDKAKAANKKTHNAR